MFLTLRELAGVFGVVALAGQLTIGLAVYLAAAIALNVLGVRQHLLERFPRIKQLFLRAR
jgi:hypothetical protein